MPATGGQLCERTGWKMKEVSSRGFVGIVLVLTSLSSLSQTSGINPTNLLPSTQRCLLLAGTVSNVHRNIVKVIHSLALLNYRKLFYREKLKAYLKV